LKPLNRQKPNENFASHRAFTRGTYYADHYLPVLLNGGSDAVTVKVGFDWKNGAQIKVDSDRQHKKLLENLVALLPVCDGTQTLADKQYGKLGDLFDAMKEMNKFSEQLRKNGYCYLAINKRKLHEFWMERYNTKTGNGFNGDDFAYKNLQYRTERVAISKPEDLFARLNETGKKADKNFTKAVEKQRITLPAKKEWENCLAAWQEHEAQGVPFGRFLRKYFKSRTKGSHQKVRKEFSLPILTGQGKFMVRRKSWKGGYIYQIVNDSDSRGPDNKPNISVRLSDGSLGIKLARWAKNQLQPECLEEPICQHGFRKVNARKATKENPAQPEKSPQDVRNEFFEEEIKPAKRGKIIVYKGKVYNKTIREAFRTAMVGKLQ